MSWLRTREFGLTEEQRALQLEARRFATEEIGPVAAHFDESSEFPASVLGKAHSLGLLNVLQSSSLGGTGLSVHDACLVTEEIAAGCSGFATSIVANDLALIPIRLAGTPEQHERFIKPICEQGLFASFCLTEPGAGSDAGGISTTIGADGTDYVINGTKQWITNGGVASQFTVFATVDRSKRHKGVCCVVVPGDAPGVTRGKHENKMGQRCSNTVWTCLKIV